MPLSRERNTPQIGSGLVREIGVKANVKIYAGAIVVNDAGVAAPARTATGLVAIGRAERTADNTGGSAGAIRVRVQRGVFGFKNQGDDAIVAADIGKDCYLVDDETVAKGSASNTRSIAGKVFAIDGDTVFVEFF
jgi:hypothetical protein